ncbi:DUF5685 family protein [Thermoanaerobacterium thermosaccharolyticum]|mgnify:FL=1|uniref:Uncharacterized protein n=1 Tax=Thermoanaerobacterium thermosaccharolyticum (strain ATCC 7956 / DSM 571 / NCIMB 9385 / NCA 3814 / NCTC 13789 / WDCM 00135 / 2032) TaxID=580327 RepID=D9TQE2_THETC|nr:DUF5685 family protein [Thermoanaerobacterium thermosaccharolyticum]ADL69728.1 conserved hypothetical protein [Thermoanaerobacterium thermosaccharolyticum DSM 571]KAA5806314.1 hypothetical protein F1655_10050 [Thermoanaerobacterium thermosaccharolyticum]TCW42270.1 hypothetical protein EDC21_102202 [Thermohydrogenium kirishiense]
MFGYVKPYKPEMKIKDYDVFKAYYCGLCKEIGRRYGETSRLTLNYELTYLAIFLSGLSDEEIDIKLESCIANPLKKKPIIKENPFVKYSADMNAILVYYKFIDDKADGKATASSFLEVLFRKQFKKSYKLHTEKAQNIRKHLETLQNLEKGKCSSVDESAEPFANILREVFLYENLDIDEKDYKKVEEIAYHLGRYIYILDAYNDLKGDIKNGNYNPFIYQYNLTDKNGEIELNNTLKEINEWTKFNLTFTLSTIVKLYEQLKFKKNIGIIDNIFRIGLYMEFMRIMEGEKSCRTHTKF